MLNLSIPAPRKGFSSFNDILAVWGWFSTTCLEIHGITRLPSTFSENDGVVREHEAKDPDDPLAPPCEYNHDWRTQEMTWTVDGWRIGFFHNKDLHGEWMKVKIEDLAARSPGLRVEILVWSHIPGQATLHGPAEDLARWSEALRAWEP